MCWFQLGFKHFPHQFWLETQSWEAVKLLLKTRWHSDRKQHRAVTDRVKRRKRGEEERQWKKTEAFSGRKREKNTHRGRKKGRPLFEKRPRRREGAKERKRKDRPRRRRKSEEQCRKGERERVKEITFRFRYTLSGCLLAVTQCLAPRGRDGWPSLVSFTCLSAWQADHRAPCCGAETVCQPRSSCIWHHPRSGLEHAYTNCACVTKNMHMLDLEIRTMDVTINTFCCPTTHTHYDTNLDSLWISPRSLANPLAVLPSTLLPKSPCYWQDINPGTSAHQKVHSRTHMHLHIRQLDS